MGMKPLFWSTLLAAISFATSASAQGIAFGSITNFDTVNDTGNECHGFEIELEDCHSTDISRTYNYNHYGVPRIFEDDSVPDHSVCTIRWESKKTADGSWASYTAIPAGPIDPTNGHQFTNPNVNFGGEHFGVSYRVAPSTVRYFWLIDDGAGNLIRDGQVQVAAPTFQYYAPQGGGAAQVQAAIKPPEPPEVPVVEFGKALWVKEIKTTTHNDHEIHLRDLVSDDPEDENDPNWRNGEPDEIETEWRLLQTEFSKPGEGMGELAAGLEDLPNGNEVVTRRYEFFDYIGPLDAESQEAKGDKVGPDGIHGEGIKRINGVDVDLSTVEVVGDFKGAQMAAFDVDAKLGLIDLLGDGEKGEPYADRKLVIVGNGVFTTVLEGGLPAGMSYNEVAGILSGTPTESGVFQFKNTASNGVDEDVSMNYTLRILEPGEVPLASYTVSTASFPPGGGSTSGDGSFAPGTDIIVTATPAEGYAFSHWTDNGGIVTDTPSYNFILDINHSLEAVFEAVPMMSIPDAAIGRKPGDLIGNGVYSQTGAGQEIRQTVKGRRKQSFYFSVQNDGNMEDVIAVTGTVRSRNFKTAYFKTSGSRQNITGFLKASRYQIGYPARSGKSFQVFIKTKKKPRRARQSFLIDATTTDERDRVMIEVKMK